MITMPSRPDGSTDPDRREWDVVVVGAGASGENAAQYASQFSGLSAVIIENELVGGECSFWACMPSKGLLRPVELLSAARDLPGVQELVDDRPVDAAAVLRRRDVIVKDHDDGSQVAWADGVGIDIVRGTARLTGPRTLQVTSADGGTRQVTARQAVVLATGSRAAVPPVAGLAAARPWTSRDVTNMHDIPRSAVVLGGGVVACEAATWLTGLGVEVTIIERGERLLRRQEPFVAALLADTLVGAGVRMRLGASVTGVQRADVNTAGFGRLHGGPVTVTLASGEALSGDEIIVAAGREANSTGLGLEQVGLSDAGGFIDVDDHLEVLGVPGHWLYAVGDLCGRSLLTHMGKYQGRIVGEVIAARARGAEPDTTRFNRHTDLADHDLVPQVTFTDPEVGSVGLTEEQARQAGLDVQTVEYDLAALSGTYVLRDHYVGRAKLVIDGSADVIVGATFMGTGVAELTHSATMAIVGRLPIPALWHVVPSYPTVSEVWLRLLETLDHARSEQRPAPLMATR
jgi:pyruvate/2-oxoglutarate dehydrogenase complex dihydrolipoamide dehydrogenase (E3) component